MTNICRCGTYGAFAPRSIAPRRRGNEPLASLAARGSDRRRRARPADRRRRLEGAGQDPRRWRASSDTDGAFLHDWLHVGRDGVVTLRTGQSEMGQGAFTGVATLGGGGTGLPPRPDACRDRTGVRRLQEHRASGATPCRPITAWPKARRRGCPARRSISSPKRRRSRSPAAPRRSSIASTARARSARRRARC